MMRPSRRAPRGALFAASALMLVTAMAGENSTELSNSTFSLKDHECIPMIELGAPSDTHDGGRGNCNDVSVCGCVNLRSTALMCRARRLLSILAQQSRKGGRICSSLSTRARLCRIMRDARSCDYVDWHSRPTASATNTRRSRQTEPVSGARALRTSAARGATQITRRAGCACATPCGPCSARPATSGCPAANGTRLSPRSLRCVQCHLPRARVGSCTAS